MSAGGDSECIVYAIYWHWLNCGGIWNFLILSEVAKRVSCGKDGSNHVKCLDVSMSVRAVSGIYYI